MKGFQSLTSEKFRTTFLVFYVLSSVLPVLLLIFIILQYVKPILSPDQLEALRDTSTYGLAAMLVIPFLGFFLMSWWINSLERLTEKMKAKTASVLPERIDVDERNELVSLNRHFDGLFGELEGKINEVNQYSQELEASKKKLNQMAVTDELTTLYNRRQFDRKLMQEIKKAEKRKTPLALIMLDVNNFKTLNESKGHDTGDKVLHSLGLLIRDYTRDRGIPFRYGGDEFATIIPDCGTEDAAALAGELSEAASRLTIKHEGKGLPTKITVSCGVVSYDKKYIGLLYEADRCLNQALTAGKGRVLLLAPKEGKKTRVSPAKDAPKKQ